MTTINTPSLNTLPVELIHRIFDNLDAESICLSMQYVCKRFHSITNNYNRYKLNFQSIFKQKFHRISRTTHSTDVISLTLSDENQTAGQIGLFLSLYHIEAYTRLQSVTLILIEELYLKIILEHISTVCSLTSLVITCEQISSFNADTLQLLSSVIRKNSLRKLDLALGYETINKLEWPVECSVQYLKLFDRISLNKFCTILRCLPHLQTMIVRDCIIRDATELTCITSDNISYRQLTSLSFEDCELGMAIIESLLSLTPSLVQFTLVGNSTDLFDGARWEQLIRTKLIDLNKFKFAFQSNIPVNHDITGFESLIAPYRTPFWIESKQWFVIALCIKNSPFINLYTIPDCASEINYHPKANKILCSTFPTRINVLLTMDSVREMSLDLIEMQADMIEKKEISNDYLFNKLDKLTVGINGDWPNGSIELLSTFIDLSTITNLVLDVNFTLIDDFKTITGIIDLLKEISNIRSLIIKNRSATIQTICSIVSEHVQHLQIPVNSVEDMKMILERFEHLSSITFKFSSNSLISISEIIEWLIMMNKNFTYKSNQCSLSLWLGKNMNQLL